MRVGDKVKYKGEEYYIVDGPVIGVEGNKYKLSKVPPPISVTESEIQPA